MTRLQKSVGIVALAVTMLPMLTGCHDDVDVMSGKLDGVWEITDYALYQRMTIERPEPDENWDGTWDEWAEYLGDRWVTESMIPECPSTPIESYAVTPVSEDYGVYMFEGSMMTLLATGDYDNIDIIKLPMPFAMDGNKISGIMFATEYSQGSYRIEHLTGSSFELVLDDYGWDMDRYDIDDSNEADKYNRYEIYGVERAVYTFTRIK